MYVNETYLSHEDVGLERPGGSSPINRRVGAYFVHRGDDKMIKIENNLSRLTLDVLDSTMDDLPRRYQRHTMGVSEYFKHFLCRLERGVMCYHEHH